jgi:uncharacterized protein
LNVASGVWVVGVATAMRILTISDRVEPVLYNPSDLARFGAVDLVLSCGDLPPEYLTLIHTRFQAPLYYICGNHDIRHEAKPPAGCTNLHARVIRFEGLNILGLEGSQWYNGGPYQYTEKQMQRTIRRLRPLIWFQGGIDIVIAHAPPRNVNDAEDRCHKGFECFRWLIDKYEPDYFIHGHIHAHFRNASDRITVVNTTEVINSYGYFLFEIKEK